MKLNCASPHAQGSGISFFFFLSCIKFLETNHFSQTRIRENTFIHSLSINFCLWTCLPRGQKSCVIPKSNRSLRSRHLVLTFLQEVTAGPQETLADPSLLAWPTARTDSGELFDCQNPPLFYQSIKHRKSVFYCFSPHNLEALYRKVNGEA